MPRHPGPPDAAPSRVPTFGPIVRLTHWLGAAALVVMVMSGLQIFNAHPALYLGEGIAPESGTMLTLARENGQRANGSPRYEMVLLGRRVDVGAFAMTAFPPSVTMGGWLAGGRRIHLAAAWLFMLNGLLYLAHMIATRRWRAAWPARSDWRAIGPALRDHLRLPPRLHGPNGGYNVLQKIAYAGVALGLGPLLVMTGLALAPAWDAIFPFWTDMFGGRQSARTWHFAAMAALGAFTVVHIALVLASGFPTFMRMITGRVVPGGPDVR